MSVKDNINPDLANRDRTYADRRAFVLAEAAEQTVTALLEQRVASPLPTLAPPPTSRSQAVARARSRLREDAVGARRAAFFRVLGELTYAALPLDDHEKAPHRETVLEQVAELAESIQGWDLTPAGEELLELAVLAAKAGGAADADHAAALVSEAATGSTELADAVQLAAGVIEDRVVAAAAAARDVAASVEGALRESAAVSAGNPELAALRARRVQRRVAAPLIESLYVANHRSLTEATGQPEVRTGVLLAEAICQYAMLETLSSVGVLQLNDARELGHRLAAQRR